MKRILMILAVLATIVVPVKTAHCQFMGLDSDSKTEEGFGLVFGYANQQYKFTSNNYSIYSNGIWGDSKRLHGMKYGLVLQGTIDEGFGIYWALNMELFLFSISSSSIPFDSYTELTFEMPLHLQFKQPIDDNVAFGAHTGPGMTLSCMAFMEDSRGAYQDYNVLGKNGVRVFNLTYDFALFFEIDVVRLDVQWSRGLNDHKRDGCDKTIRNKFMVGLTYFFVL